jgi:hypothetical protein
MSSYTVTPSAGNNVVMTNNVINTIYNLTFTFIWKAAMVYTFEDLNIFPVVCQRISILNYRKHVLKEQTGLQKQVEAYSSYV